MLCLSFILSVVQLQLRQFNSTTKVLCFNLNKSCQGCSIVQMLAGLSLEKKKQIYNFKVNVKMWS